MIKRLLLLFLAPILVCCSSGSSDDLGEILMYDKLVLGESIPYQKFEHDYDSIYPGGVEEPEVTLIVCRSEDEFAQFWSLHNAGTMDEYGNPPAMPEVDFEMDMVIVVMSKLRYHGGYDLQVDGVYDNGYEITVAATLEEPDSNCVVTQNLNQPCVIIAVELSESTVSLNLTQTIFYCNN